MANERDIAQEARGQEAAEIENGIGDFLTARMARIDAEAVALLRSPAGLSESKAKELWVKKSECLELRAEIQQAVRAGLSAHRRLIPTRDPQRNGSAGRHPLPE